MFHASFADHAARTGNESSAGAPDGPVDPGNPGFIVPILSHPLLQRAPKVTLDVASEAVRVAISQQF